MLECVDNFLEKTSYAYIIFTLKKQHFCSFPGNLNTTLIKVNDALINIQYQIKSMKEKKMHEMAWPLKLVRRQEPTWSNKVEGHRLGVGD